MDTRDDGLLAAGLLLFLIALLTGLLLASGASFIVNPRGLLAGHLEGAMNGMFLMLVGLFFGRIRLSPGLLALCRGTLLYGAYANWFFTSLGGILGTSEATPIAGAGHHAGAAAEQLMLVGLLTVALAALTAVGLLLLGVRRGTSVPVNAMVG